jgi:hypothetical protein
VENVEEGKVDLLSDAILYFTFDIDFDFFAYDLVSIKAASNWTFSGIPSCVA